MADEMVLNQIDIAKLIKPNFLSETNFIYNTLSRIKLICDNFDKTNESKENQTLFILKSIELFKPLLDQHFKIIWNIIATLNDVEYINHQKFYQDALLYFFELSPYNSRVYRKPLGYSGDYKVMIYLYENKLEGESTFAKLIHKYSMLVPAAIANRNRRYFYKKLIVNSFKNKSKPKITSIASGPAVEIFETLNENLYYSNGIFSLIDFESEAISYVKKKKEEYENRTNTHLNFSFHNLNIITLLKNKKIKEIIEPQDLIYCSGLIDYFDNRIASKLVENLFDLLKKGGILIIGNVSSKNPTRAFIEFLGEWHINHRDENDLLKLASNIKNANSIYTEFEESSKMNIFLIIKK